MITQSNTYTDLYGRTISLIGLDQEELALLDELERFARDHELHEFRNHWMAKVADFYSAQGLSRSEITHTRVFRIAQDLTSRARITAG